METFGLWFRRRSLFHTTHQRIKHAASSFLHKLCIYRFFYWGHIFKNGAVRSELTCSYRGYWSIDIRYFRVWCGDRLYFGWPRWPFYRFLINFEPIHEFAGGSGWAVRLSTCSKCYRSTSKYRQGFSWTFCKLWIILVCMIFPLRWSHFGKARSFL